MLTFEQTQSGTIEIYMDGAGREVLLSVLNRLQEPSYHEHLMTISWGAGDLDETAHEPDNTIINMVTIGRVKS